MIQRTQTIEGLLSGWIFSPSTVENDRICQVLSENSATTNGQGSYAGEKNADKRMEDLL